MTRRTTLKDVADLAAYCGSAETDVRRLQEAAWAAPDDDEAERSLSRARDTAYDAVYHFHVALAALDARTRRRHERRLLDIASGRQRHH